MRGGDAERLIVSDLGIGEAQSYRDHWQPRWDKAPPDWLDARSENVTDNRKVRYRNADGLDVVLPIIDESVDQDINGVYLDIAAAL